MEALFLLLIVIVVIVWSRSIRIVPADHRLVVLRFGKFLGIRGPGAILLLPFIDKAYDIDLTQALPGWQELQESELRSRIMNVSGIDATAP